MNHKLPILLFFTVIPHCSLMQAQDLSSRQQVLEQMNRANDYFMAKWPDPTVDIVTDKVRPSNLWTRATYYEGLMALYRTSSDTALYDYAVEWGEGNEWRPTYTFPTRNADNLCCGQGYIELFQISGDSNWISPIRTCIDLMVNSSKEDDWWWIDAIQMAMPVFAKLGYVLDDTAYFEKMYDLYSHTKYVEGDSGLYNQQDHLWWRDATFVPPVTTPNGLQMYWSRGNGWVYAALTRVLDVIPEGEAHRAEYLRDFLDMSEALISIQREDGFWNPSLVDPDNFGGKESSGTGFLLYGLAWGINQGLLDSATYYPHVVSGWEGMVNDALHCSGFLGWMQSTGKEPKDGQPLSYDRVPNFEDYGLGAFLLAGAEVYRLAEYDSNYVPEVREPARWTDTVTACVSFKWIDGKTYTENIDTAIFIYPDLAANGCDSIVTLNLTINKVDVSVTDDSPTVIANAVDAQYQWIDCRNGDADISGETGQSFTATENGRYAVEVTQNGCTDVSACIRVAGIGISESSFRHGPVIFPNPTGGEAIIELDRSYPVIAARVFRYDGRMISSERHFDVSRLVISLEGDPGIYLIELSDENIHRAVLKLLKK